jgi:hypothetical protein
VEELGAVEELDAVVARFKQNVDAVLTLSNLDRQVIEFAISAIEKRDERLQKAHVDNARMLAGNTLQQLKNIRENDSLRPGFQALVNQSVVLLASYFASGMADLFSSAVPRALAATPTEKLLAHELRLKVREAREMNYELQDNLAELIITAANISFQDTKSIARSFGDYLGIAIVQNADVNDIIAGLACRHAIVHSGGMIDRRCAAQLQSAKPRSLKIDMQMGDRIQFRTEEVAVLSKAMTRYVENAMTLLKEKLDTAGSLSN